MIVSLESGLRFFLNVTSFSFAFLLRESDINVVRSWNRLVSACVMAVCVVAPPDRLDSIHFLVVPQSASLPVTVSLQKKWDYTGL